MEYGEKEFSIQSAIAKGRPLPEWAHNVPDITEADVFYLKAFYDLTSCREVGMGLGPIPWRDIYTYAIYAGFENDLYDHFIQVIREMDAGYLEWQRKKQEVDKP